MAPEIKNEQIEKSIIKKIMSSSLIESAAFWFGVVTVAATAIAALAGSLSWYFSYKVSSAKDAALLRFQTESKVAISAADARAAEANEKAERERLARIRLEEDLAWRRLSKEQEHLIASQVTKFSGQIVSFWYGQGDKEAETFAWELARALNAAGWKVFSPAGLITMASAGHIFGSTSPQKTGISIASTDDKSGMDASQTLVRALLSLGFDVVKNPKTEVREASEVLVNIEVRPQGPQGTAKIRGKNNKLLTMASRLTPNNAGLFFILFLSVGAAHVQRYIAIPDRSHRIPMVSLTNSSSYSSTSC